MIYIPGHHRPIPPGRAATRLNVAKLLIGLALGALVAHWLSAGPAKIVERPTTPPEGCWTSSMTPLQAIPSEVVVRMADGRVVRNSRLVHDALEGRTDRFTILAYCTERGF